jgi:hypothetical protein
VTWRRDRSGTSSPYCRCAVLGAGTWLTIACVALPIVLQGKSLCLMRAVLHMAARLATSYAWPSLLLTHALQQ